MFNHTKELKENEEHDKMWEQNMNVYAFCQDNEYSTLYVGNFVLIYSSLGNYLHGDSPLKIQGYCQLNWKVTDKCKRACLMASQMIKGLKWIGIFYVN